MTISNRKANGPLWITAASEQDLDEIEKRYADEPMYEIQVEDLP